MNSDFPRGEAAKRVTPRALRGYATGIELVRDEKINGTVAVYHRAGSPAEQVVIPLDEGLDDYPEMVSIAVSRLASFEGRSPSEVFEHLLLPPADLLRFRDAGSDVRDGTISLSHAAEMVTGLRKALLAQAHSVVKPQPYHPRLSRGEAESFVNACRFGQTRQGSFVMTLACPLDAASPDRSKPEAIPFAREVTSSIMTILSGITRAVDGDDVGDLLSQDKYPLLNANFCEALVQMRPDGDRPVLQVSANWSRSIRRPNDMIVPSVVSIDAEGFRVAQDIGSRLRDRREIREDVFVGFVEVLRGVPGPDGRVSGETILTFFGEDGSTRVRMELNADDYATAASAHLANSPLLVVGKMLRLPRLSRMESVKTFVKCSPEGYGTELAEPIPLPPPPTE